MADNVGITPGTGAKAWTDEVADGGDTVHKQILGLADAAADSTTRVHTGNGTATNALRVALPTDGTGVVGLNAGENHVGSVGASDTVVTVTASLDTNAYTAGDVLFDTQEIASAARVSGGVVVLQSITVLDKDDQGAAFDLVFLDAATSLGTENAEVSITDANAEDILGIVSITADDYADLVNSQVATKTGIGLEMKADASTSLYVGGIARGTPTHTASGLVIKFAFLRG